MLSSGPVPIVGNSSGSFAKANGLRFNTYASYSEIPGIPAVAAPPFRANQKLGRSGNYFA